VLFIHRTLHGEGYRVVMLHGKRSQAERNAAVADFKSGKAQVRCYAGDDVTVICVMLSFLVVQEKTQTSSAFQFCSFQRGCATSKTRPPFC
jgi:hypothetical protein